mmetsp:Transcript_8504/g.21917  ORF Transcript_8504/g.21917 Transcript_8504/m.21917 type:complete len:235 (+) Transcript_8504:1650-2354(+)
MCSWALWTTRRRPRWASPSLRLSPLWTRTKTADPRHRGLRRSTRILKPEYRRRRNQTRAILRWDSRRFPKKMATMAGAAHSMAACRRVPLPRATTTGAASWNSSCASIRRSSAQSSGCYTLTGCITRLSKPRRTRLPTSLALTQRLSALRSTREAGALPSALLSVSDARYKAPTGGLACRTRTSCYGGTSSRRRVWRRREHRRKKTKSWTAPSSPRLRPSPGRKTSTWRPRPAA